jgi:hypothetical protein
MKITAGKEIAQIYLIRFIGEKTSYLKEVCFSGQNGNHGDFKLHCEAISRISGFIFSRIGCWLRCLNQHAEKLKTNK